MDRHLPCGAPADARGHVRIPDRQRGRRAEEDNLRHLVTNLGRDVPRERIVPFLTSKHTLEYCLSYADRAHQSGFPALVVLGGDKSVGTPRSVEHAWQLRQMLRAARPCDSAGRMGQPARAIPNVRSIISPHRDSHAEFYLTQVVSHHRSKQVSRFVETAERRGVDAARNVRRVLLPQRESADAQGLSGFLPVPVEGLTREFAAGATPEDVCARTHPRADRCRRAALLHQQPADRARPGRARRDHAESRGDWHDRVARCSRS